MQQGRLIISSRNYSSWSLRGWLLCRLAGLDTVVETADQNDPKTRDELLNKTSSIRLPCLVHEGVEVWDAIAIAEYLNETYPNAKMMPEDRLARARCRSISGEMHSGFAALRSSLPMNLKARGIRAPIWSAVRADIERITEIWTGCLSRWKGPWLFGEQPSIADAMYAPVVTRFITYSVSMDPLCASYGRQIMNWAPMVDWIEAAKREPEAIAELDVEVDVEF